MSERRGHIKLSRKLFEEDPWWNEKRPRTRIEAWLDVLYLAAYRSRRYATKYGVIDLDRGQFVASRRMLADRWRWSEKAVRNFLEVCQKWARIRAQRETPAGTVYLIVNYDFYQNTGPVEGPARGPETGPVGAQRGPKREAVKQVSKKRGDPVLPPGYLDRACEAWKVRGVPNAGLIGKVHKPLVARHGDRQVLLAWEGYLADRQDREFAHPVDFATNYELYRRKWAVEISEDGTETPVPDEPRQVPA